MCKTIPLKRKGKCAPLETWLAINQINLLIETNICPVLYNRVLGNPEQSLIALKRIKTKNP